MATCARAAACQPPAIMKRIRFHQKAAEHHPLRALDSVPVCGDPLDAIDDVDFDGDVSDTHPRSKSTATFIASTIIRVVVINRIQA